MGKVGSQWQWCSPKALNSVPYADRWPWTQNTLLYGPSSIAVWIIVTEFWPDCRNISVIVFSLFFDLRPAWYSLFRALVASPIWSRNNYIGFHSLNELNSSCVQLRTNVYTNNHQSTFLNYVPRCQAVLVALSYELRLWVTWLSLKYWQKQ